MWKNALILNLNNLLNVFFIIPNMQIRNTKTYTFMISIRFVICACDNRIFTNIMLTEDGCVTLPFLCKFRDTSPTTNASTKLIMRYTHVAFPNKLDIDLCCIWHILAIWHFYQFTWHSRAIHGYSSLLNVLP